MPRKPEIVELTEETTVFRGVPNENPESADFIDACRSRTELNLPPRRGTPEVDHPELNGGISVYDSAERLASTIRIVRAREGSSVPTAQNSC